MIQRTRREFLNDIGTGAVVASVGTVMAADLGFSSAFAEQGPERLNFGSLESLVSLMQETPPARLMPIVADRLRRGTELRTIVAAAALANARLAAALARLPESLADDVIDALAAARKNEESGERI